MNFQRVLADRAHIGEGTARLFRRWHAADACGLIPEFGQRVYFAVTFTETIGPSAAVTPVPT